MSYKPLKLLFDRDLALRLGDKITRITSDFDTKSFAKNLDAQIHDLEYKDRIDAFATELHRHLDLPFEHGIEVLISILGPEK